MKKAALIYLALVLGMAAFITGAPWKLLPSGKTAASGDPAILVAEQPPEVNTVAPADVASMAAQDPTKPSALAEAVEQGAASQLAAAEPAAPDAALLLKPMVQGGDAGLDKTTSAILSELAILPKEPGAEDEMEAMSNAAVQGLKSLRGGNDAPQERATLESLVAKALKEGKNDAYIYVVVNEAASAGRISVPKALVTADGKVDTAVLLSTLVTKAQIASGQQKQVNPSEVVAGGEGVEVRLVTKATGEMESYQFYTVLPGDSLGAIAIKFYGDAAYFPAIFDANRALLSSPDKLNVGQRLVVPAASTL